jgi:hypothetical protein
LKTSAKSLTHRSSVMKSPSSLQKAWVKKESSPGPF